MTVKIAQSPPPTVAPEKTVSEPSPAVAYPMPPLPTFDWEVGYKYVYNPQAGAYDQVPLTLLDILYPTEEDIGRLKMVQSPHHDLWTNWLKVMLWNYLGSQDWLVTNDVLIHWGRKGAPPKSPDVAVMPGGQLPAQTEKSYRVHRDGPLPVFVMEITSEDTRVVDLQAKTLHYAAVGVKELLIIDFWPDDEGPWQLLGYRLEESPYYQRIAPDDQGGLTFETIALRFVAVDQERIEVYQAETGARLLTPEELKAHAEAEAARADAETARADAEAAARAQAEARVAQLEARLQELQARDNHPEPVEG
jgi:Uma2 family endonuclease